MLKRKSGSLAARQQGDGGWNKPGAFDDWACIRLAGQANLTLDDLVRELRGDRVLIRLLHQAHFDEKVGTGLSLQVRTNFVETLEADVQATLKLGFAWHRRMTAKSPSVRC